MIHKWSCEFPSGPWQKNNNNNLATPVPCAGAIWCSVWTLIFCNWWRLLCLQQSEIFLELDSEMTSGHFMSFVLTSFQDHFFFSVVKSAARLIILLDFNFYFSVKCCEIRKAWPEVRTWTFLGSLSLTVSDLVLFILTSFASFVKRRDNTLDFKTLAWELNFLWLYISISL